MPPIVLLVDDDENLLRGLARALRDQPYHLFTARSGEEAIEVLKTRPVDVVVSDERMPGISGGELLAWTAEHCPDVMRIVLTGHATAETAIRAINEGGVYHFFTKPCNVAHLAVTIRKAIEHKTLVEENRRLLELSTRQVRQLDRMGHDLRIVARIASHDLRETLATIGERCGQLEGGVAAGAGPVAEIRRAAAAARQLAERLGQYAAQAR
jgi:DNA-binding NtrC family response regulator